MISINFTSKVRKSHSRKQIPQNSYLNGHQFAKINYEKFNSQINESFKVNGYFKMPKSSAKPV